MSTLFSLPQNRIPTHWYNIMPDLPEAVAPPLHPGTKQPAGPADFAGIFADNIIEQEVSTEGRIAIPDEVRQIYALWRPTPLRRAVRLEQALGTPAHIYYKYEGTSPAGSHKPNSAVPQAYYNKQAGIKRIATETGAGQWGSSLALACNMFGIECVIYMVKVSYHQKPYRKSLMHAWGATVHPSPSKLTHYGKKVLEANPDSPGSLGIAISEALEYTAAHPGTKYALGSVLNHVCLHQTVIGIESIEQMELAGEEPDVVIGCAGGGSNFAGIAFPFIERNLKQNKKHRLLAVEPSSCPSLTKGEFRYDHGDTAMMTPLMKMYTLGHDFIPPSIHAGGLRYHGMSPIISQLYHLGMIEARAYPQAPVFEAAIQFAKTEAIIPAPESAHAIRAAIDEALDAKAKKEKRVILFNLSGHGFMDMTAYDSHLAHKMEAV